MSNIHRRKSSKEENGNEVTVPNGLHSSDSSPMVEGKESRDDLLPRNRVVSSPGRATSPSPSFPSQSPSPGPFRTGFSLPQTKGYAHSAPGLRPAFSTPAHLHLRGGPDSRTRSISSGPFTPSSPSPLSMTFPSQDAPSLTTNSELTASSSSDFPRGSRIHTNARANSYSQLSLNGLEPPPSPSTSTHSRRHSRLHSRNLSVFFPRPGSLPHSTIAEDGSQEIVISPPTDGYSQAGVPMPSASPTLCTPPKKFGEGFTFGGRPPPVIVSTEEQEPPLPRGSRRGHHHKHSLSHNFFSFLEPGSMAPRDLTSQHTPSPYPQSASPSTIAFPRAPSESTSPISPLSDSSNSPFSHLGDDALPYSAIAASIGEFAVGAWMWIVGQGVGSLACTGLGYWVVFDAIGVAVTTILPVYLRRPVLKGPIRRPFGTRRLETVALFAQVVYLMFSAVYVFKETVEHVLLSAGEGHHHHSGDEDVELLGIDFPVLLPMLSLFSLLLSSLLFDNHNKLVSVTGSQLPPLPALFDPSRFRYSQGAIEPSSKLDRITRNPFSLVPISACTLILLISATIPASSHRTFDLFLAAAEATAMFHLAYPSCKAIGSVLLQTAPARGLSAGRIESFLRAMREIERHPQVLHLPPPHIWQLSPSVGAPQPLVVTLELRVASDLGDIEVVKLTRWAWERSMLALGLTGRDPDGGGVTVGIVRGKLAS